MNPSPNSSPRLDSARVSGRFGILAAIALAAVSVATFVMADDVTVIEQHQAKIIIAGEGSSDVFEINGELEVGESRQFFTEDDREVVVLRTDDGYEVSIDGDTITTGLTTMKMRHGCDGDCDANELHIDGSSSVKVIRLRGQGADGESGDGTKVKVIHLGEDHTIDHHTIDHMVDGDVKVIRLDSATNHDIEIGENGRKMVFIGRGDDGGDHDGDHVWVSSDDASAYAFTLGEGRTALEHLETSGALDKLDEETREKVLKALRDLEEETQSP